MVVPPVVPLGSVTRTQYAVPAVFTFVVTTLLGDSETVSVPMTAVPLVAATVTYAWLST